MIRKIVSFNSLKIFNDSHETSYGYQRITLALRILGHCVNHKRVQCLMQKLSIKCMKFSIKVVVIISIEEK
ncbi:IS3 family transposase [Dolosigranulum pigrum]